MKRVVAAIVALLIGVLASPGGLPFAPGPAFALGNPCSFDPNNLIVNGMMAPGGSSPWGSTAANWNAFVLSGSPSFSWVNNEGFDADGSQYIQGSAPYDAGIYQTVVNLTPGVYYHFWVGYALAAYDPGGGSNMRFDQIGRRIGVDLTGGTDPNSPNVAWGDEYTDGQRALNIPSMSTLFAAQGARVTFFIRATNHATQYLDKAWFDSVCMEPQAGAPTATAGVSSTPTPTLTATASPTFTPTRAAMTATSEAPRAMAQAIQKEPPATSVPPSPTSTATQPPTDTPTATGTFTPTLVPSTTPRPRRAIPISSTGTGASDTAVTSTVAGSNSFNSGMVVLVGSAGLIGLSGLGIISLAAYLALRLLRNPAASRTHNP